MSTALFSRVHVRCMTLRDGEDYSEWQRLIWEVNSACPEGDSIFGRPDELGPWWAGGSVEEYPDARVIHRGDGTVSIVSKTERGDTEIREAAGRLGINVHPLAAMYVVKEAT